MNRPLTKSINRLIDILPVALPAGLVSFSVVVMVFLLLGQFKGAYVWALGLLASIITVSLLKRCWYGLKKPGSQREQRIVGSLAVIGVALWVGFNIFFTAQHIYTNRDPATYTVTSIWLTKHDNLQIDKPTVFEDIKGVTPGSAGFGNSSIDNTKLFAQGAHLLPALMGLAGRTVGVATMLHLNVLFGGLSLLAIYNLCRLLVKPRWALVATASFALTLPLMYFSRDTYTEPLSAAFIFCALGLLWVAQKTRKYSMWLLTGLAVGIGSTVRVDAYLIIPVFATILAIMLAMTVEKKRLRTIKEAGSFVVGVVGTSVLGWLDVSLLSSGYYKNLWSRAIKPEFLLISVAVVTGVFLVAVSWRTDLISRLDQWTAKWRAKVAAMIALLVSIILVSRPLWYTGYRVFPNGQWARTYAEHTVEWVAWYMGPIIVLLSIIGLMVAAYKSVKSRDLQYLPLVLVVGAISLFYFVRPSVYPDQIWASRRFMSVTMPGVAVLGAIGISWLYKRPTSRRLRINYRYLAVALATLAIVGPLFISYPFLFLRPRVPQLGQMNSLCNVLPRNSAVILVGAARLQVVQPTRALCDLPAVGYTLEVNKDNLSLVSKVVRSRGAVPVIGVFGDEHILIPESYRGVMTRIESIVYRDLEQGRRGPPRNTIIGGAPIFLGEIQDDGKITALPALAN